MQHQQDRIASDRLLHQAQSKVSSPWNRDVTCKLHVMVRDEVYLCKQRLRRNHLAKGLVNRRRAPFSLICELGQIQAMDRRAAVPAIPDAISSNERLLGR